MEPELRTQHLEAIRSALRDASTQFEVLTPRAEHPGAFFWVPKAWDGQFRQLGSPWTKRDGNRWVVCSYWRDRNELRFELELNGPLDDSKVGDWRVISNALKAKATNLDLEERPEQEFQRRPFQKFVERPFLEWTESTSCDDMRNAVEQHLLGLHPKLGQVLAVIQEAQADIEKNQRRIKPGEEFEP